MRFRFCGGEDCPDWLLAEIASLAAVSVVKVRQLTAEACRLLSEDKQIRPERLEALVADTKLQPKEVAALITAVHWIVHGGARDALEYQVLGDELQQLGMPKEHAGAIARVYRDRRDGLLKSLRQRSLRLSHLESIQWHLQDKIGTKVGPEILLHLDLGSNTRKVLLSEARLRVLVAELETARNISSRLQPTDE